MKILDRHVLRVFLGAVTAAAIVLVGLFVLLHLVSHVDELDGAQVEFANAGMSLFEGLCLYYALHIPEVLVLLAPYGILFASIYTVAQLERDNELVPMYAVGVSRARVTLPIFLATALLSTGLVTLREVVIPGNSRAMETTSQMLRSGGDPVDRRVGLMRDGMGNVFLVGAWNRMERRLENVHMFPPGASRPIEIPTLSWTRAEDGRERFRPPEGLVPDFASRSDLDIADVPTEVRNLRRLSFFEIRRQLERKPARRDLAVLLHERVTYALTPFVMLLFGLPLVMRMRRGPAIRALAFSLVLALGFFAVTQICQRMGSQSDTVGPMTAAWLPILSFSAIGLVLAEIAD